MRRNLRYYADYPELQLGGPTYHWVRKGILAGEQVRAQACAITTPVLLIQAGGSWWVILVKITAR